MNNLLFLTLFIVSATALSYFRASLKTAAITSAVLFLLYLVVGSKSTLGIIVLLTTTGILAALSVEGFRKKVVSRTLLKWYKRILPPLSKTEQEAIDAGTVWWEGELFTGRPNWRQLLAEDVPKLTDEEQAFIDGPVEELCKMVNSWQLNHELADIPPEIMTFIKEHRFLGMIIPKAYGGLEFSAVAQSEVLTKLFSVSNVVGIFVMVPNSLGPGELLMKYGTEQQKQEYLPKLAVGEEIPCFALTGPLAGSDATSIPDTGIVCKGEWQGKEIIGMRLSFDKRYITLAPIATLIGLAFKLRDPDHLLGEVEDYGITCALIPHATAGVEVGRRHYPTGDPFHNGPVRGKDIFVPLDYIIGGQAMAGKGWTMLVNCLSVGRCISLPSLSNSIGKRTLATTGAYARLRKQFNLSISQFEGIQKPLARMAGLSYIINAARLHTAQAIVTGEKPAVPASILKYHCTEMARQIILDGFDIHGGKAVMKGPKNYLASSFESIPVAITVEGANIMTRSLMIFGQGAIRCHPYTLKEIELANRADAEQALDEFDEVLFKHIGSIYTNAARSLVMGLTGSLFEPVPSNTPMRHYYKCLSRFSAAFALVTDVAMFKLQASLKRREMLSARLGDMLSMLYLASMVLKHYENQGRPYEDLPVVEWSLQYLLHNYQTAMEGLLQNFPNDLIALMLRLLIFPLGKWFNAPTDRLEVEIANLITRNTKTRNRMIEGIFSTPCQFDQVGELNELLQLAEEFEPLEKKMRDATKAGKIAPAIGVDQINAAEDAKVINNDEASRLRDYHYRVMDIINVDDFPFAEFSRENRHNQSSGIDSEAVN